MSPTKKTKTKEPQKLEKKVFKSDETSAIVEDGIVISIVVGDIEGGVLIPAGQKVMVGDLYSDGNFSPALKQNTFEKIRARRDFILKKSDWTQLSDSPLSAEKKSEWATYRQALRDVTEVESPDQVTWPTKPS